MLFIEKNLKNFKITKNGYFRNIVTKRTYHYHYACNGCGYPHLGGKSGRWCSGRCAKMGENSPTKRPDVREKLRINHADFSGDKHPMYGKTGILAPMFGKLGGNNKGDVTEKNIPLYNTYAPQLEPIELCVRDPEYLTILNVGCFQCKKQYRPTRIDVMSRIRGIKNNDGNKFYCSDTCKSVCRIFKKSASQIMEQDAINAGRIPAVPDPAGIKKDRTLNNKQKKERLEENGYTCDWCAIPITTKSSILHHEVAVVVNPLMVVDKDNHWVFCKPCHKKAHTLYGCNYYELRIKRRCKT